MPSRKALAHAVLAIAAQLIADEGWHRALGDTALSVVITAQRYGRGRDARDFAHLVHTGVRRRRPDTRSIGPSTTLPAGSLHSPASCWTGVGALIGSRPT